MSHRIFLDLDGTVINPSVRHFSIYMLLTEKFSAEAPLNQSDYWNLKRGGGDTSTILKKSKIDPKHKVEFEQHFKKLIESPSYLSLDTMYAGTFEVLSELQEIGELHLLTLRRETGTLRDQLDFLEISSFFSSIWNQGDSQLPGLAFKSQIMGLFQDTAGYRRFMIGDTPLDIHAARNSGVEQISVSCGLVDEDILCSHEPSFLVQDLTAAKNLLLGML